MTRLTFLMAQTRHPHASILPLKGGVVFGAE